MLTIMSALLAITAHNTRWRAIASVNIRPVTETQPLSSFRVHACVAAPDGFLEDVNFPPTLTTVSETISKRTGRYV